MSQELKFHSYVYFEILPCKRSPLISHKFKIITLCTLHLPTILSIMAKNSNVVYSPSVKKQTIRKSPNGKAKPIPPTRRLDVRNHYKTASVETRRFRLWLETHPDIWSEVTFDRTGTIKTTTYTNITITTTNTVSVTAGFETVISLYTNKNVDVHNFRYYHFLMYIHLRCVIIHQGVCYRTKSGSFP